MERMEIVKEHFEDEAQKFDQIVPNMIPHYETMLRSLIQAIPFSRSAPLRAVDLGCGTGTITKELLQSFPDAQVTCVDVAENMIACARAKLADHSRVDFVVADFNSVELPRRTDVVLSSLALHHLATDEQKQNFYRRVYESLRDGGVFYNADVVLASNDFLQNVYMNEWRQFMGRSLSQKEIEEKWISKYYLEDRPAGLVNQLQWLTQVGFAEVDVLWKYYNFAVYGGIRRS